ncbi:MAG: putative lipid II flippase FtsW [Clostridiales bacterium]|jgi:cell division protein FtsW|nr:putative lipid II flippase FtsW [Clostridiales bacterium]MDR2749353.1 putative lipid II flippase FtsW [Clostridiales bacterium]
MQSNALGAPAKRREGGTVVRSVIHVGEIDYTILLVVAILGLIGVVMVFSSSYQTALSNFGDAYYYLKRQGLFFIAGLAACAVMANFNYNYLRRWAFAIYTISNFLLVLVLIIGISSHGATRWIPVPIIGQFQPSEVAKAGVIFFIAFLISHKKDILLKWPTFILVMAAVAVTAGLVFLGNNMSTAIIVFIIGAGIIFMACPYIWRFVIAGGSGVAALVAYLALTSSTDNFRAGRFAAWLAPEKDPMNTGYQVLQSLYAIASGGMFGLGLGQSRQKTFLPEAHNDIIFSIICEELGFVGAAMILILFSVFIWRGVKIALNAPDTFSSLTAIGIVLLISSQVLINVAVVTNSIPNTGVPLPFVSYGGTSFLVAMGLVGVLLNISRCAKKT